MTKFSGEQNYQDKVNARKDEIIEILRKQEKPASNANLGALMVESRIIKANLETQVKEENLTIAALDQILVEKMEAADYTSLKLGNGVSLTIKDDVYATVKDKTLFHTWVKDTGQDDLFTVNYQTMSSLVKNNLMEGEEPPPGVEAYFKQSITVRGVKNLEQD